MTALPPALLETHTLGEHYSAMESVLGGLLHVAKVVARSHKTPMSIHVTVGGEIWNLGVVSKLYVMKHSI